MERAFLADGTPVIFDPAPYYGDRECDIAMTELFGGYPADFHAAYRAAYPLDAGYTVRKDLYNLYHILNHDNLFGGDGCNRKRGLTPRGSLRRNNHRALRRCIFIRCNALRLIARDLKCRNARLGHGAFATYLDPIDLLILIIDNRFPVLHTAGTLFRLLALGAGRWCLLICVRKDDGNQAEYQGCSPD